MTIEKDKINFLVVDDNKEIHEDFAKIFKEVEVDDEVEDLEKDLFESDSSSKKSKNPFEIILDFASSGDEALKKVEASKENPYAVIFMDVRMPPGIDGIIATSKIIKMSPYSKVVICSAYSDYDFDSMQDLVGDTSNVLFIRKPFDELEIKQMASALSKAFLNELELKKYTDGLEVAITSARNELEQKKAQQINNARMVALGEMAGGVAHEVNNPLTVIKSISLLIKKQNSDDEKTVESIDKVLKNCERIYSITKSLLNFTGTSFSRDNVIKVDIREILQDAINVTLGMSSTKSVDLSANLIDQEINIECNRSDLLQVFVNLITNAVKSFQGLDKENKTINISYKKNNDSVEVYIQDNGCGIEHDEKDKIMLPFYSTNDVNDGQGLGLSIATGLIKKMNGKLTLDQSGPGKGSTFKILLPIKN